MSDDVNTATGLTPLAEIGNPAAVGWEWSDRETGTTYQIVWSRGARSLMFGMRRAGGEWVTTGMDRERWSVNGTLVDARSKACEFHAAGQSDA